MRSLCRAYVAAADPGADSKSNTDPPNQTEETLDGADNVINEDNLPERRAQLHTIIKYGLERMDEKRMKYKIGDHEYVLQDQIAQAANLVLWAKGWISEAVKASPEASIAWAGVCVILPVLTNPSTADEANRDGFTYVTTRMRYYVALEPLLLRLSQDSTSASEEVMAEFKAHMVDLYQHILDFQFRSVLRFYRGRLGNLGRDLIQSEDWNQMRLKIMDLENTVFKDFQLINSSSSMQELERLNQKAEESCETMEQHLSLAKNQLRVTEEHRDLSLEQLQVQKEIAKKILPQDEERREKCHQLFRLTKDNKDETYEWYKNRVEDRVEGTCTWFLNHKHFQEWLDQDSGPLLVSADPGCGKSVLAKYLIDHQLPRSATICYFFFKDQDQNTIKQALCALLHQLFSHKPSLIRHAMPHYEKNGASLVNITASLWDILERAGQDTETGPVIFVLDALDECAESDFTVLISMLKHQFQKHMSQLGKVKFLLTSRPYGHIVSEFQELVDTFPNIRIPGEDESETLSQEVNRVITHRVNQLAKEKKLTSEIKEYLEQRLLKIRHRTYLWVYLVFDYIKSQDFKKTTKVIESLINTLPESVNQAYERILSKSTNHQIVRKALCIILAAYRPLTLAEMNIAVNINIPFRSMEDLDLEEEKDFEATLRSWCGLFVSIYDGKVYFLHQTAREFLLQESNTIPAQPPSWHRSVNVHQAHTFLAEICVHYLDSGVVLSDADEKTSQGIDNHAFLDYSAKNWVAHFREAYISNVTVIPPSVSRICDPDSKSCLTWFKVYWMTTYMDYPEHFTALMIASYFGLEGVVKLLLAQEGVDVDSKDSRYGQTPLSWAAENGHEAVVKLLLAADGVVDSKDAIGQTPLSRAAENGHEAVVKLLLAADDVDVDSKDDIFGQTPLSWAADKGREAVVKLLLAADGVDVDSKDAIGQTPLSRAAENGHEAVVKLLLAADGVDVDSKDSRYGQTPLSWAAENGHEAVVKLLLAADGVDVDSKDSGFGQTPLSWAAEKGHKAVVKLLLAADGVDVDSKDSRYGQTPLSWAAENGHEAVVKLLLAADGVDVDSKDDSGQTPLSWAARDGHEAVVKLLQSYNGLSR